jgi:hypothetical protein
LVPAYLYGLFVAVLGTLYGALMSSDHEAEIRASVAAHADLGPAYDDGVAEGLVERIGAEIDKRIDARLGQFGATGAPGPPGPVSPAPKPPEPPSVQPGVPGAPPPPAGYPGYQPYQGYLGPMLPPGYQVGPPPARPSEVHSRNVATTITALGSMAMGVAATAIVSHAPGLGGQGAVIFLIWAAIAVINVVYARRP